MFVSNNPADHNKYACSQNLFYYCSLIPEIYLQGYHKKLLVLISNISRPAYLSKTNETFSESVLRQLLDEYQFDKIEQRKPNWGEGVSI